MHQRLDALPIWSEGNTLNWEQINLNLIWSYQWPCCWLEECHLCPFSYVIMAITILTFVLCLNIFGPTFSYRQQQGLREEAGHTLSTGYLQWILTQLLKICELIAVVTKFIHTLLQIDDYNLGLHGCLWRFTVTPVNFSMSSTTAAAAAAAAASETATVAQWNSNSSSCPPFTVVEEIR